jgi:hypothetical protein
MTQIARARAAERMRRSRNRHRSGLRCDVLDSRNQELEALVRFPLLAAGEQTNRNAVVKRRMPSSTYPWTSGVTRNRAGGDA